jgi:hypothetical protein
VVRKKGRLQAGSMSAMRESSQYRARKKIIREKRFVA